MAADAPDAAALAMAADASDAKAALVTPPEASAPGVVMIAAEASELVVAGAAPVGLASRFVAEDLFAPSKGSSVSVSSAGVESLAPPSESLSRTGVAMGSPVSSCSLRSSSGSMRSVAPGALDVAGVPAAAPFWSEAASCAGCVGPVAGSSTTVAGVIPRSISGSINSSPAVPGAAAAGVRRSCAWTEPSRAGRTGRPGSRGSSIGRSVRGSSIKRDAGSTGSCLVAGYPATPGRPHLPDGSQIEVPHLNRVIEVSFDIIRACARCDAGYLNARAPKSDPSELQGCSRLDRATEKAVPSLAQKQRLFGWRLSRTSVTL